MNQQNLFEPARRPGLIFHLVLILALGMLTIWMFSQAASAQLGPTFLLFLLGTGIFAFPIPILIYRLYGLYRSIYLLGRDGIRLRWGLRLEDIPISDILWMHTMDQLDHLPSCPLLRWPGSVLGIRSDHVLGEVEYMASRSKRLVLLGTSKKVFAISPENPDTFLTTFQSLLEMGSLEPIARQSIYPTFLLLELLRNRVARGLLLAGALLNIGMLVWVSIAVPRRSTVSLGFTPSGSPLDLVASVQLFLLPVASLFFYACNFVLAAYFYRQSESHPFTYLLWGMNIVTPLLFMSAIFIILSL
jgi:hypothetical protein